MNRTLFVHQFDQFWPAIGTVPIAPVLAAQGFNRVAIKALDGDAWMSQFDTSSDAISSPSDLTSWETALTKHGLSTDAWVNVTKGTYPAAVPLYREVLGAIAGRLILDLEPYEGFWGDESSLQPLFDALTTHSIDPSRLALCYDPRRPNWLAQYVTKHFCSWSMPQIYSKWWASDLVQFERAGVPHEIVLSTDQSASEWWSLCRDASLASRNGRTGFAVFRAPIVATEHLAALRSLT